MLRTIRWTAYALIAALLVAAGATYALRGGFGRAVQTLAGSGVASGVQVGGPFTLVDQTGRTVTDASFRGRWMLVYFGYTFCPDVCPTELQSIAGALDQLGPLADKVVPLFITVDPERDTQAHMAEYVKLFDDRLVGLTGTPEQTAAAAKAYRVYYARVPRKDSDAYLMDHSSFIYLMAPDGHLAALLKPGMTSQALAEAIRARLSAAT